jgi:CMP-N-acetylneuraminic acid synthetase
MLMQEEDGTVQRLIEDEDTYKRRQDTPEVLQPSGAVYAMRRELLRSDLQLPVADTKGIRMSVEESVNIDEMWEYHLACTIWESKFGDT